MASVLTTRRNPDGSLTFAVAGEGELTFHPRDLSAEVSEEARYNGLTQTMVDAAALPRDEQGRPATPAAKWAAIRARYETLASGYWNAGGVIYQAIARVRGIPYGEARAWFDAMPREQRDAVRKTQRVRDAIAEIQGRSTSDLGDAILDAAGVK
jgi:hypothetical protein